MKSVEIRYGVTFGKCDSSDWIDYEIDLTDEEADAYDKAIAEGRCLDSVPELQDALQRAYEEIEAMDGFATVKLYSDSAYLINCYKPNWWKNWRANGWKNSKKEPVANQDLWEKLIYFFMKAPGYDFIKVKGHAGNTYNEMVDDLAVAAKMRYM